MLVVRQWLRRKGPSLWVYRLVNNMTISAKRQGTICRRADPAHTPATLSLLPAEADAKLSKHSRLILNIPTSLMHPPVRASELVLPPCVILQQGG